MIILLSVDDEDDNDKEKGWKGYFNVDGNDMNLWKSSESEPSRVFTSEPNTICNIDKHDTQSIWNLITRYQDTVKCG